MRVHIEFALKDKHYFNLNSYNPDDIVVHIRWDESILAHVISIYNLLETESMTTTGKHELLHRIEFNQDFSKKRIIK